MEQKFIGSINGNNIGSISLHQILHYVKEKTGMKAILTEDGLNGPYNGQKSFSLNVEHANNMGFRFTPLNKWIYKLLDKHIQKAIFEKDI